jgi:sterol desaturase/sphingolipid hydroxylase (fatty acid hydroxylase superfamily)
MSESDFQTIRGAGFLFALALALSLQRLRPYARWSGSWRVNGSFWIVNLVVIGAVCGACACTVARWAESAGVGLFHRFSLFPPALQLLLTILALDLVSYAWHRANHRIGFLWRFHRVHHSDPAFTASTAVRFHPGELLLSLPLRLLAVAALGASPAGVVLFEIVFTIANFFEHGDISLPLTFERLLQHLWITPALHRRHHSRRWSDLNTNFGTVFVFWDRLFHTYLPSSSEERVTVGLPDRPSCSSLREALLLPLAAGTPTPSP